MFENIKNGSYKSIPLRIRVYTDVTIHAVVKHQHNSYFISALPILILTVNMCAVHEHPFESNDYCLKLD